ncbi:MAG: ComF family protein [Gammaproteobacteria bacterium]|nr:MAG: ComF family protein [Gammaproteobacteria bacterium]
MPGKVDRFTAAWSRILPQACALCGLPAGQRRVCRGCRDDLPWLEPACPRCARPLPFRAALCDCSELTLAGIDRLFAALAYEFPVDGLLAGAKFGRQPALAAAAGELLAARLARRRDGRLPALLLPVPLHRRRLRRRGFNQALEIARPCARRLGIPLRPGVCRRTRDTPPQSGLGGPARRRNLTGAFAADRRLRGLRVAIVDDVVTTGSTVSAVATALRAAGAAAVEVFCVARVLRRPGGRAQPR